MKKRIHGLMTLLKLNLIFIRNTQEGRQKEKVEEATLPVSLYGLMYQSLQPIS
ncbi:putative caudovirales tail fiber assembly protein [Escherichia coli 3-475-03_S4_C2]|nr:putative caudovirales tail fiber assembly protein [Escherichia coli 3-475-03_S4_C2]KDZ80731.1 putative caudovirales tail fiber assembly protein [Escherichia coli 3-105-05_S1_C3]